MARQQQQITYTPFVTQSMRNFFFPRTCCCALCSSNELPRDVVAIAVPLATSKPKQTYADQKLTTADPYWLRASNHWLTIKFDTMFDGYDEPHELTCRSIESSIFQHKYLRTHIYKLKGWYALYSISFRFDMKYFVMIIVSFRIKPFGGFPSWTNCFPWYPSWTHMNTTDQKVKHQHVYFYMT